MNTSPKIPHPSLDRKNLITQALNGALVVARNLGGTLITDKQLKAARDVLANANLFAEAGNVANQTGLTPRQLADRVSALESEAATLRAELTEVRAVSIQRRDAINGHHMARGWERQLSGELATAKAQNAELLAALQAAIECGLIPSSSAREGGACAHSRQAQVADQVRDAVTNATGGAS